jgi:hypothetical protein
MEGSRRASSVEHPENRCVDEGVDPLLDVAK